MITRIVKNNVGLFEYVLMGLLGFIILFTGIVTFGSFGGFTSGNIGSLLWFIVYVGLIGILLYCIAANRTEYTKFLAKAYLAYYAISTILIVSNPFYAYYEENSALRVSEAVFMMFAIFAFIALVVIGIIIKIKGAKLEFVFDILAICYLAFEVIVWILALCVDAKAKTGWAAAMNEFTNHLLIPWSVVIGYYLYQIKFVNAPQDEEYVAFNVEDTVEDKPVKTTKKKK